MAGIAGFLRPALQWAYVRPNLFPKLVDIAIWPVALVIGAVLKLVFGVASTGLELIGVCIAAMLLQAGFGWAVGLYKHRWRVSSFDEVMA